MIQRKVVAPADFADLDALTERLTAFQARYNATATPFDWRFTRTDPARHAAPRRRPPARAVDGRGRGEPCRCMGSGHP
ncbi:MAG: hypothetical protein ACT4O0_13525 [Pseudonocardia sp.]